MKILEYNKSLAGFLAAQEQLKRNLSPLAALGKTAAEIQKMVECWSKPIVPSGMTTGQLAAITSMADRGLGSFLFMPPEAPNLSNYDIGYKRQENIIINIYIDVVDEN